MEIKISHSLIIKGFFCARFENATRHGKQIQRENAHTHFHIRNPAFCAFKINNRGTQGNYTQWHFPMLPKILGFLEW